MSSALNCGPAVLVQLNEQLLSLSASAIYLLLVSAIRSASKCIRLLLTYCYARFWLLSMCSSSSRRAGKDRDPQRLPSLLVFTLLLVEFMTLQPTGSSLRRANLRERSICPRPCVSGTRFVSGSQVSVGIVPLEARLSQSGKGRLSAQFDNKAYV